VRLLLHAITPAEAIEIARGGLRGHGLGRVDAAGLTAWVTALDGVDEPWGRADLLEHHAIVSHLHDRAEATLPSRFPTWSDDEGLRAQLETRQAELQAALDRVRGRSEVAVTATWTSPLAAAQPEAVEIQEPSGTSFLRARQRAFAGSDARRALARALAEELTELVGGDSDEMQSTVCPSPTVALALALLVPTHRASDVIARLPRARQDVRILVNGPWPAYTFAVLGAG
jgi:gas vesicle protein GvpL/GvpF